MAIQALSKGSSQQCRRQGAVRADWRSAGEDTQNTQVFCKWDTAYLCCTQQLDLAGRVRLLHAGRQATIASPGRLAAPLTRTEQREAHALHRAALSSSTAPGCAQRCIEGEGQHLRHLLQHACQSAGRSVGAWRARNILRTTQHSMVHSKRVLQISACCWQLFSSFNLCKLYR